MDDIIKKLVSLTKDQRDSIEKSIQAAKEDLQKNQSPALSSLDTPEEAS